MDIEESEMLSLLIRGASGVRFNSPLGTARAAELTTTLTQRDPHTLVDFGCGNGELTLLALQPRPALHATGIDRDHLAIEQAQRRSRELSLDERASFVALDVADWTATADAGLCVGAPQAFGGLEPALTRLGELVPDGRIVIADGFWATTPDDWCLETFGALPLGLDGVISLAATTGWRLVDAQVSTQQEWDEFESGWRAGVESVGTPAALAFAARRRDEYDRHYRTVLGFGWLVLDR